LFADLFYFYFSGYHRQRMVKLQVVHIVTPEQLEMVEVVLQ
jgi:hypothetical protein